MKFPMFDEALSEAELSLKAVVTNFQVNYQCSIRERNCRATEEFLPTQATNVTFYGHTWTIFQITVEV